MRQSVRSIETGLAGGGVEVGDGCFDIPGQSSEEVLSDRFDAGH